MSRAQYTIPLCIQFHIAKYKEWEYVYLATPFNFDKYALSVDHSVCRERSVFVDTTNPTLVSHTHTLETLNEREGFQNSCILSQDLLLEQGKNIEFI